MTKFFLTIASNGKEPLMATSKSIDNVRFLWKRFVDRYAGSPVIEKVGNRIVFDVRGTRIMINYGEYSFDEVDPFVGAMVKL